MRFIPAGAGNTQRYRKNLFIRTVYPRWRGEHLLTLAGCTHTTGLSPLARGTQNFQPHIEFLNRFIPAGAGNTAFSESGVYVTTVYPRWRGEH
ncbi:hypothetical protein FORC098_1060 [Salmonella enterica subsp. enterica serovar Typhimurium]|nr:hypothetical protein FORC098_1060 [Salmonella enterica subsp. enterica serovar Typhimurium]